MFNLKTMYIEFLKKAKYISITIDRLNFDNLIVSAIRLNNINICIYYSFYFNNNKMNSSSGKWKKILILADCNL